MPVSRRDFLASVGVGGAGVLAMPAVTFRGRESLHAQSAGLSETAARRADRALSAAPGMIRIDSNENPNGPGARVLESIKGAFGESNRYPAAGEDMLKAAIAKSHGIGVENVMLGCGSGEILRVAVQAFTSADKALISAAPTFEAPANFAKFIGSAVRAVREQFLLTFQQYGMSSAAKNGGLIFFCNPNNPTATVHGKSDVASFIDNVNKSSPGTTILVDEAYHEYVENPDYATAIPIAMKNPRVFVARTFSKVFGMAGMRVGYAIGRPETLAKMEPWLLGSNINQLALAGAQLAITDMAHIADEQKKNRATKAFTRKFFEGAGYEVGISDANFLMVNIKRDVKAFKADLLKRGVAVGRPFPPLNTHLRVSIGTMAEMEKAVEVMKAALAVNAGS